MWRSRLGCMTNGYAIPHNLELQFLIWTRHETVCSCRSGASEYTLTALPVAEASLACAAGTSGEYSEKITFE